MRPDRMTRTRSDNERISGSSELISRISAGNSAFVAIPAFPSRMFRHGFITVNRRSGIKGPKDLEGRRIGTPLYTQTAAIWLRGQLEHDYGVDLSRVTWVQGAINLGGAHGDGPMVACEVSTLVNTVANDGPGLLQAV